MSALGVKIDPTAAVLAGAGLTMVFLLLSGVRAPAFVSFVKDGALLLGAILIGLAAIAKSDGTAALFDKAADAGAAPASHYTLSGSSLTFTMTTIVFQALGFFVFPFIAQGIFAAKSEGTLKRAARFNPLYMLMYPFLVAAAFAAVVLLPKKLEGPASNQALLQLSRFVLPDWLTGLVAGGAALCAIVVLCGSALGIGSMVSRNIIRGIPAEKQRSWVRVVIFGYLVVSLILTLELPSLLLTLVNTSYYGVTQAVIVFLAMIFGWRIRPLALAAAGVIIGDALVSRCSWCTRGRPLRHGGPSTASTSGSWRSSSTRPSSSSAASCGRPNTRCPACGRCARAHIPTASVASRPRRGG